MSNKTFIIRFFNRIIITLLIIAVVYIFILLQGK